MDSKVNIFELQNNTKVEKRKASLAFPQIKTNRLYIITNQGSRCHFIQNPEDLQNKKFNKSLEEKKPFQYGSSIKIFSVTDYSGIEWEVRLLLSPSEIDRQYPYFNLFGFISTFLVSETSSDVLSAFCGRSSINATEKIIEAVLPFLSFMESEIISDYQKQLDRHLCKIKPFCMDLTGKEAVIVSGTLITLLASELATSVGGTFLFDYREEKPESQTDHRDMIEKMVKTFGLQAELLSVSHQGKTMHILFRNPCPDNWASGCRKCLNNGETFELGLCHRVFSISEEDFEIQFLQSLQESYDLVTIFHIAAFAKHLIMTKEGRKILEELLKEDGEEIINELSKLALKFVCIEKFDKLMFLKSLSKEIAEKMLHFKTLAVCELVTCMFGVLVVVLAGLQAKSTKELMAVTHDENIQQNVAFKNDAGDTETKLDNSHSLASVDSVSDAEQVSTSGSNSSYNNPGVPQTGEFSKIVNFYKTNISSCICSETGQADEISRVCGETSKINTGEGVRKEPISYKKALDMEIVEEISDEGIIMSVSKQDITDINNLNKQVDRMDEPVFTLDDSKKTIRQDTPAIDGISNGSNIFEKEIKHIQLVRKTISDSPIIENLQGSITPISGSGTAEEYTLIMDGMENTKFISTLPLSPSDQENTTEELDRTQDQSTSIDPNANGTLSSPGNHTYLIVGAVIAVFIAFGVMQVFHVYFRIGQ